jgi:hypothetical protein
MSAKKDHPEGLVLAIRKDPRGTEEIRIPITGTRRKCCGKESINTARPRTAMMELAILIAIVDAAMSTLANQLIVQ